VLLLSQNLRPSIQKEHRRQERIELPKLGREHRNASKRNCVTSSPKRNCKSSSPLHLAVTAEEMRQLDASTQLALGNRRNRLQFPVAIVPLAPPRRRHFALRHSHQFHVTNKTISLFWKLHPAVPLCPGRRLHRGRAPNML
jgi:hypothetical protein